jgi:hypothetical protein
MERLNKIKELCELDERFLSKWQVKEIMKLSRLIDLLDSNIFVVHK